MLREEALEYHSRGRPGKIALELTKPCVTQRDLSLAYTPGVAEPVREIARDPLDVFKYTARGNLVAVVSNGTAVLGLGNQGPLASKPVMEGKALLFKRFADVDVFDIEIDATDPEEIVRIVKSLEPTFGGINLEDIKAPECFVIEEELKRIMDIPVFHDDQHGTAIIAGAGLLNAIEITGRRIENVHLVMCGAGAAAIACAEMFAKLGLRRDHITMVDTKGVIYKGRSEGMNPYKERFAAETAHRTLAEAMVGADVFIGLSAGNLVSKDMVRSMAPNPIIFAMANPDPEIRYEDAHEARPDAIVATGRSDYPNQVNNVLGFPFIFRGALDVRARAINDEMKMAASRALAALAKEEVPDVVLRAYGLEKLRFGPDYIIPKPIDPRVALWEAPAVAEAAMASGVARRTVDLDAYREELSCRLERGREVMSVVFHKAQAAPKRVVYSEGEEPKVIRAAAEAFRDRIALPILLGRESVIRTLMIELRLDFPVDVIDPWQSPRLADYATALCEKRQRKGITLRDARALMRQPNYFGAMMVHVGDADALIAGLTSRYSDVVRPALQVIGARGSRVAGMHLMIIDHRPYLCADPVINVDPSAEELAEIAILAADQAAEFDITPRVAMLSFSTFGSFKHARSEKVALATALIRQRRPDLMVDGEMMADMAVRADLREVEYPFSTLAGDANVLIFPSLEAANTSYLLLQHLGRATTIGPILLGMNKPVHVLRRGADVPDIVNTTAIAVAEAALVPRGT
ncbi:MAG: NADP-dependent malic enzyme [Actinomycetota bacterium]